MAKRKARVEGAARPVLSVSHAQNTAESPAKNVTAAEARQASVAAADTSAPNTAASDSASVQAQNLDSSVPRYFPNPVPGDDGDALKRIFVSFRERFPEEWENIRLCPLQHGEDAMADILRGRG